MDDQPKIGFVGLGRMGRRLATNLVASGAAVVVHNRTTATAETFAAEMGTGISASLRELAERCTVVVTMLVDGAALVDVYTGDDGLLAGMGPGSVGIDMGTSGPEAVASVRAQVEAVGGRLIDAPVSGSTEAAEAGTLMIMVGGSPEDYAGVEAILSAMGRPERVGPPGSGATSKLAVNSILFAINGALAEAVILAERSGVSPAVVLDVVSRSAAGAPLVGYRKPQYLDPDGVPVTSTIALAVKDLVMTLDRAAALDVAMPQAETTLATLAFLDDEGHGDRDLGYVIAGLRRIGAESPS